jgi:hypothetical protein
MSPQLGPSFETRVRTSVANLLSDVASLIDIDSIGVVPPAEGSHGQVLLVDFHVKGAWASPAEFTFPFDESVAIDQSLKALRDMIARNWQRAHLPPPVAEPGRSADAY